MESIPIQTKINIKCMSNLHWALAGGGRGGGRGNSGSLGKQGLTTKLVGTVLSSRLFNSHFCCRSILIWRESKQISYITPS